MDKRIGDKIRFQPPRAHDGSSFGATVEGTIDAIRAADPATGAAACYGVTYRDHFGRERHTWIKAED
jgi:hypothetical protein